MGYSPRASKVVRATPDGGGDGLIRRVLVLVVAIVMAGVVAAPAANAQYIPGQPGFIITPPELPDTGGRATITGFGCPADVVVSAYVVGPDGEIFIGSGQSPDDPDGSFSFEVTVPPLPGRRVPGPGAVRSGDPLEHPAHHGDGRAHHRGHGHAAPHRR